MKNKDLFETYEAARDQYNKIVVPLCGATRMDWGFGRWLWLDAQDDALANWRALRDAGILTAEGRRMLARVEREAAGRAPAAAKNNHKETQHYEDD